MEPKLWLLAIFVALALNFGAEASSLACRTSILGSLYNVHKTTMLLERHLKDQDTNSTRTKRSTLFITRPEKCKVPVTILQSMHLELDTSLSAAKSLEVPGSICSTSTGESNGTDHSCESLLQLIRCGVTHLRTAYTKSSSVTTTKQQEEWEQVVRVMAANTEKVVAALKDSMDKQRLLELDALTLKLQQVQATLSCMEQVIRDMTPDAVVDKILIGQPTTAFSLYKELKANGSYFTTILSQAYNRIPQVDPTHSKRVENSAKITHFLAKFLRVPQLGAAGLLHLLKEMKASGHWPKLYPQFKRLLRDFNTSSVCLPVSSQLRLYSLHEDLQDALLMLTKAVADLIHAGNPSAAFDFYKKEIGSAYELPEFKPVITSAYNRPINGSRAPNVDNILKFIEKFNQAQVSIDGLNVLHDIMKLKKDHVNPKIFLLKAHYDAMHLSDVQLLEKIQEGISSIFEEWSHYVGKDCGKLKQFATEYQSDFNASQIVFRGGVPRRALQIADCIDEFPSVLHGMQGYQGLLNMMDHMDHIDTFDYMETVDRYRQYTEKKVNYPRDIFNQILASLPDQIQQFIFPSGYCQIVSSVYHQCIATKGGWYWGLDGKYHARYDTSYKQIGDIGCRWNIKKGRAFEWSIESGHRKGSYLYASQGPHSYCHHDHGGKCFRTFVWKNKEIIYNGFFRIKPYNRAQKFSIINTHYTTVLFAYGNEVYNFKLSSIDEEPAHARDFWYFKCKK